MAESRNGNEDAERYKQAANDALQQLDFCIGFLSASNKGKVAARLAQNRAHIREKLMGEDAQPVPVGDE